MPVKSEREVREELNILEKILEEASSTDEYLGAILKSQNLMVELLRGQQFGQPGYEKTPPDQTAGISISDANSGDTTEFLYKNSGRTLVANVNAARALEAGEVAKYDANQGGLIPVTDVEQGDLDFGAISEALQQPSGFGFYDTDFDTGGQNVTIQPGDNEIVLEADVPSKAGLYEVGTNDETYSEYQYIIDGEEILPEPIPKPLGLYNDRFRFPKPLRVTSSFKVKVFRDANAPSSKEYYSNAVIQ